MTLIVLFLLNSHCFTLLIKKYQNKLQPKSKMSMNQKKLHHVYIIKCSPKLTGHYKVPVKESNMKHSPTANMLYMIFNNIYPVHGNPSIFTRIKAWADNSKADR